MLGNGNLQTVGLNVMNKSLTLLQLKFWSLASLSLLLMLQRPEALLFAFGICLLGCRSVRR